MSTHLNINVVNVLTLYIHIYIHTFLWVGVHFHLLSGLYIYLIEMFDKSYYRTDKATVRANLLKYEHPLKTTFKVIKVRLIKNIF